MMKFRIVLKTAEAFERIRMRGNMTWFAEELGVSRSYASDLLYQRRGISDDMSKKILAILSWRGRTWNDLFETESYTTGAGAPDGK